ncbi:hypothetical protein J2Z72_001795 [Peptostreptococcus canis]|nr:hypothetical protein [Peptostreptococcus canis]
MNFSTEKLHMVRADVNEVSEYGLGDTVSIFRFSRVCLL